jgi:hypothetical protein
MTRAFSVFTHGGTWEEAAKAGILGFLAFSAGTAALSLTGQALAQVAIRGRVFTGALVSLWPTRQLSGNMNNHPGQKARPDVNGRHDSVSNSPNKL